MRKYAIISSFTIAFLILLLGNIKVLAWQQPIEKDTTQLITNLLTNAAQFRENNKLSESLENYLRAIRLLEKQDNPTLLTSTYEKVGTIYKDNQLYEKSIEYYSKANEITPNLLTLQEDLGDAYFEMGQYTAAIEYYSEALELCLQKKWQKQSLEFSEHIIACYHAMGDHDKALKNELIILSTAQSIGDSSAVATTLNNIGYAHKYLTDYKQAISYFKNALALKAELQHPQLENVPILLNLGIVYQNMQDYDNALDYLLKAVKIVEASKDKKRIAEMYDLLASLYYQQKDYHNAQEYSRLAIEVGKTANTPKSLQSSYLTSSLVHQEYDEYQEALEDYKVHLQINDSLLREERLRQQSLLQQQLVFERSERELQQLISEKEVSELARKQQELELEKRKKELEISRSEQKLQTAQLAQQRSEQERAKQALLLTQQLLETEKRDKEVAFLRQQEALQKAEGKRKEEEAKRKELELREEKNQLAQKAALEEAQRKREQAENTARTQLFTGGFIFLLIVVGLILWGFSLTRKKNKTLAHQQNLIKERNSELSQMNEEIAAQRDMVGVANEQLNGALAQITDSVRYAKRIQDSILLPPTTIINHFEDAFVFFQPRDIVSGDFYWFARHETSTSYNAQTDNEARFQVDQSGENEKLIIAAVDCTGHGVPGAFMSLIGNDLLNEIVNLLQITKPNEILAQLSSRVRETLKQEQTANRDGMDMALCTIDKTAKEVHFAGAKNCLVYVQNGELHQVKGDKMAIGGRDMYKGKSFVNHTISIESPTTFYIFSDGFQDQFGGPNNRKFMTKRFRNLLFEIHEKPMSEQREILVSTLKKWMGNIKQLDDVLVVGFRC